MKLLTNRERNLVTDLKPHAPSAVDVFARLHSEENSGSDVPARVTGFAARLHGDRRGAITVLFILLAFVFFMGLAGVWNIGQATKSRMRTQVAADTSAYGAATWMSRGMNQITAANILIQRNASAFAIAFDCIPMGIVWLILVIKNWAEAVEDACGACLIACAACGAAVAAYIAAVEVPVVANYIAQAWPVAASNLTTFWSRVETLKEFQDKWVQEIPNVIEAQRGKFADHYGVTLRYTQPGASDGKVRLPVEEGNFLTALPTFTYRFFSDDDNIPDHYDFDIVQLGKAEDEWKKLEVVGYVLGLMLNGMNHYTLSTQTGPFEQAPSSLEDWEKFSLVATALSENISDKTRIAPGIFTHAFAPDDVNIAYAQAETYNGPSEALAKIPGLGAITNLMPFRVWTFFGFEWQPRLTVGDQVKSALENDSNMANIWGRIHFDNGQFDDAPKMANH